MFKAYNKAYSRYRAVVAFFIALAVLLCLPHSANAADLGTEKPHIYLEYRTQDGKLAQGKDGALPAGTYDISIVVEGLSAFSALEFTATCAENVTVDPTPLSLLSDTHADVTSMGEVLTDGDIIFGFISDNDANSAISSDGTVLASFRATFEADYTEEQFNAENIIQVNPDPNVTFVLTNYADGLTDQYALVDSFEGYVGNLYLMTCDVFPAFTQTGYDITGRIDIAADPTGASTGFGIVDITVDVLNNDGSIIATAVTNSDGSYTLQDVPTGEYKVLIHGNTTVDRQITLSVDGAKTVDAVGIVTVDVNKDKNIDTTDLAWFLAAYGTDGEYTPYADFNKDGGVDTTDLGGFLAVLDNTITYDDVIL